MEGKDKGDCQGRGEDGDQKRKDGVSVWEMRDYIDVEDGGQKKESKGQEEVQRWIRESELGKPRGLKRGLSPHLTHLRGRLCNQPEVGCGRPWSNTLAAAGGPDSGRGGGKGFVVGPADAQ